MCDVGLGDSVRRAPNGAGRRRRCPRLQPVVLTARRVSFLQTHQLFFFPQPKVLAVIPNPSVDQPNRLKARSLGFTKFGQGPEAQLTPGPPDIEMGTELSPISLIWVLTSHHSTPNLLLPPCSRVSCRCLRAQRRSSRQISTVAKVNT